MSMNKLLRKILKDWKRENCVKGVVQFSYDQLCNRGILTIYTSYPERFEPSLKKYTEILRAKIYDFKEVKFVNTDKHCIF